MPDSDILRVVPEELSLTTMESRIFGQNYFIVVYTLYYYHTGTLIDLTFFGHTSF
jgi:hypothetical protein